MGFKIVAFFITGVISLNLFAQDLANCEESLSGNLLIQALKLNSDLKLNIQELSDENFEEAIDTYLNDYRTQLEDVITTPGIETVENTLLPLLVIERKLKTLKDLLTDKFAQAKQLDLFAEKQAVNKLQALSLKLSYELKNIITETLASTEFRERLKNINKQIDGLNSLERQALQDWNQRLSSYDQELKQNPLLLPSGLDYGAFAFDKFQIEHFYPALLESVRRAQENFKKLVNEPNAPTFENTVLPLLYIDFDLDRVETLIYLYSSNNGLPEIKAELTRIKKVLNSYRIDLSSESFTNEQLYKRVKAVADAGGLNPERQKHIKDLLESFDESGISFEPKKRAQFLELKKELSNTITDFTNNVVDQATLENFHVIVTNPSDLAGIEKSIVDRAKKNAESLGLQGWAFDSEIDTVLGIYEYAESDDLRKRYWIERANRNNQGDEFDNTEKVKKIVRLRHEIAGMLGYKTHSHMTLEDRMAKTPERVMKFLDDFFQKVKPKAEADLKLLADFKKEKTGDDSPLKPWELYYWEHNYKKEKFNFDSKKLKPYFEVNKVLDGAFKTASKLYGITITERPDLPVFHPSVKVFEVTRGDEKIGLMYVDLFSRKGEKREGAWMNTMFAQDRTASGERIPPIVSINANFSKSEKGPTYLHLGDVTTVFHEFGHALHGLFSNVELKSHASPQVAWDFVELPSQFMENYVFERQVLDMFAYNEEGESLPNHLLEALNASETFGSAWGFIGQLKNSYLDMGYYSEIGLGEISDLRAHEKSVTEKLSLLESTGFEKPLATSFSHIMSGGYSSGYYSYKWAEVLDADAIAAFKESGDIFNPFWAQKFEKLLANGSAINEDENYLEFRGQEPSVDHLLRRKRIIP